MDVWSVLFLFVPLFSHVFVGLFFAYCELVHKLVYLCLLLFFAHRVPFGLLLTVFSALVLAFIELFSHDASGSETDQVEEANAKELDSLLFIVLYVDPCTGYQCEHQANGDTHPVVKHTKYFGRLPLTILRVSHFDINR